MIIREFPVDLQLNYSFGQEYDLNRMVFFDIETTGLDAKTSYLYLIGCIYIKEASFHLIQWFSEGIEEEIRLIRAFFEFIQDYDVLIHYNGAGFDVPYLLKKCRQFHLNYNFDHMESLDLYKKITPYKKLLKLSNYKQKTVENFLKIARKDVYSGGDLIEVYQSYLGKKNIEHLKKSRLKATKENPSSEAEELLDLLLLHNEDDLKGLVGISSILHYVDLFEKPFHILQALVEGEYFIIQLKLHSMLPSRISCGNEIIQFRADGSEASLYIKIFEGELKHFYDNYKDYFYLPKEDSVVHKSLAIYVEKEFREKAKPANCYVKKTGIFVPQFEPLMTPYFKENLKDKTTYLQVHTDSLLQEENLIKYVKHIFHHLNKLK